MSAAALMVDCRLCPERVELAAIAVHLTCSHDLEGTQLADAVAALAPDRVYHHGVAYAAGSIRVWLSRRELTAALTATLVAEGSHGTLVDAVGWLRTLCRTHAVQLAVAALCRLGRGPLLATVHADADLTALVDGRVADLFPELAS